MRILIACDESQVVCKAFRERGFEAYSCDIQDCSGGHPEWHIKEDIFFANKIFNWDLVISFPPCTHLAVSGSRHFETKRKNGVQKDAIEFFFRVWKISNCTENPVGIMGGDGRYIKEYYPELFERMKKYGFPFKPSQTIQPWMFGHGETKATCLWLKGLPNLLHSSTDTLFDKKTHVKGREQRIWKMPPSNERAKLRSKTYQGIADAMAQQWGDYLLTKYKKSA